MCPELFLKRGFKRGGAPFEDGGFLCPLRILSLVLTLIINYNITCKTVIRLKKTVSRQPAIFNELQANICSHPSGVVFLVNALIFLS